MAEPIEFLPSFWYNRRDSQILRKGGGRIVEIQGSKIAIISESFSYISGVGVVLRILIKFLTRMGTIITLIGPEHSGSEKWEALASSCVWLPSKKMKSRGYYRTSIFCPCNNKVIVEALSGVDIAFCESISTLVLRVMVLRLKKKINCKIVFHAHTMADRYLLAWFGFLAWPLILLVNGITWFCLWVSNARIAPSQFFANRLLKMQWWRKKPVSVWSAPISLPELPRLVSFKEGGFALQFRKEHEILFVCNGRIGDEKRTGEIIDLVLCLREQGIDVGVIFVGGGEIKHFRNKIAPIDRKHFLFTGGLDRAEGLAINAICDFGIALTVTETQSLSVLEQMAMGLPIIVSKCTVLEEYAIRCGCGLILRGRSIRIMCKEVIAFLNKKEIHKGCSERAKAFVAQYFSSETLFESLKRFIEELLAY